MTREMVMVLVLAELQSEGRDLGSLTPEEIKERVERAVEDLVFAERMVVMP